MNERFRQLHHNLLEGAAKQDAYDLSTINLIAPASPTPLKYFHNTPLRHNAIAEGLLGKRPYAGVEGFNMVESAAVEAAKLLFGAEHANIQPHSVSQANQAVYQALLENGDSVLAMSFDTGGHLTHGLHSNFSGRFYDFHFYGVNENGFLNYQELEEKAAIHKPKLIVVGGSSYPRSFDFEQLQGIASRTRSYLMADLSHPAGLIVGGKFPDPFPHCDVVTLTLDKTMLGPHGGIILSKQSLADQIDKAVHPGVQSSIPLRRIFEMGQCLIDAATPEFQDYVERVITNMKVFEKHFSQFNNAMVTGGSDTHLMVIQTREVFGLTGKEAEEALESVGILTNRQVVPGEMLKPYIASGIRFGTSWITARGYTPEECGTIAEVMTSVLTTPDSEEVHQASRTALQTIRTTPHEKDVWYEE